MAEILEFGKRSDGSKAERDAENRRHKVEALRSLFQCSRCAFKCAKCGTQLDQVERSGQRYVSPYPLCRHCHEEYQEYRTRVDHPDRPAAQYWHNALWMKVWESWLEHQRRLDEYRRSKEFLQLVQEVEELLGT